MKNLDNPELRTDLPGAYLNAHIRAPVRTADSAQEKIERQVNGLFIFGSQKA